MLERARFRLFRPGLYSLGLSCLGLSCIGAALLASTLAASAGPAGGGGGGPALGGGRAGSASIAAGAIGRMAGARMAGHRGFGRHAGGRYRMRYAAGWPGSFDPGFGGGSAVVVLGLTQEAVEPPPDPGIPVVVGIRRPPEASPVIYRIEGGKGRGAPRVIRLDADGASMTPGARIVPVNVR